MAWLSVVPADVVDTEYEEAVAALTDLELSTGTRRHIPPDDTITRAELAKLLITALNWTMMHPHVCQRPSDVGSHWAKGYVGYADKLDIVVGYPDKSLSLRNPYLTMKRST